MQDGKRTRVAKINFQFLVQSIIHLALHACYLCYNTPSRLYSCIDDNFQIIKVLMFFIFCSKDRLWFLACTTSVVRSSLFRIPTICRLKQIKDNYCICMYTQVVLYESGVRGSRLYGHITVFALFSTQCG